MMQSELTTMDLFIGIILAITASCLFAIGLILQKKALMELPEIKLNEVDTMKEMIKNKKWVLGIALSLLGGIPYFLTQAFLGIALGQPLILGLQVALTVIFAIILLNEKVGRTEAVGFLLLIISPIFLALGAVTAPSVELTSTVFIVNLLLFLIPGVILCVILFLLVKRVNKSIGSLMYALISGVIFAMGAILIQVGVEGIKNFHITLLILIIFSFIIMMVGNTVATLIQQLAFQKGKVGVAFSVQSTANILLAVLGGILIFNQRILAPHYYVIGIIMILIGIILLVQFQARLEELDSQKTDIES